MSAQLYLFKDRRFLPLFITQFCGCLNDCIIKNALIIIITYHLIGISFLSTQLLVLLTNAIYIFPFIIFAGISGQLADKYERSYVIRIIKAAELLIVGTAIYGFYYQSILLLFVAVGMMGIHSTFFGPLKYSVIPDNLKKHELLSANGFVEAATFIGILLGTMLGGLYNSYSKVVVILMAVIACAGVVSSLFILPSNNSNADIKLNRNIFAETINIVGYSYNKKHIFLAILGISWFWFIGAKILSQLPILTKYVLGADEGVANLFLAVFSIGVGVGSFVCSKIFKNEITTKYVFLAAIGMGIFGIDLFFATKIATTSNIEHLRDINAFLSRVYRWRIVVDLFGISFVGGLYTVPLYASMQYFCSPAYRSRVVAASNVVQSIFMIGAALLLSVFSLLNISIPTTILIVGLLNLVLARYIYKLTPDPQIIPDRLLRGILKFVCDKAYKVEVKGIENFYKAGKRVVVIANHVSYLDSVLLGTYLPEKMIFAIDTNIAQKFWIRPFLKLNKTYPVDTTNPMSIKALIAELRKNRKIAIFPEGRMSSTGILMKIYEGPGMIADKSNATILPVCIDGAQYTNFTRLRNMFKTKWFPKITINIMPPVRVTAPDTLDSKQRRKYIGTRLYEIMSEMLFKSFDYQKHLFVSVIESAKIHGYNKVVASDTESALTYRNLITKSFVLGKALSRQHTLGEYVGVLLPNANATLVVILSLLTSGVIPSMLNFTSGVQNVVSACHTTQVKTIYTSRKFVDKAEIYGLISELEKHFKVIYLEDFLSEITLLDKIGGIVGSFIPKLYFSIMCRADDDNMPSFALFTSGTEGRPKAVILSHRNIQAGIRQCLVKVDFNVHDRIFNALPMFHCFGLVISLLSCISGSQVVLYPSPLHYRLIPEMIYDSGATILFTTDTFLNNYMKFAHPYDFYSIRYIFTGAEKLKPETVKLCFEKFGTKVLEGYGATEASPTISVSTVMHNKLGTVGKIVSGLEFFIQKVEGIAEGGKLIIKGPNVMLGYMLPDNPGVIVPPQHDKLGLGWYDTGDVVYIDEDGYMKIISRLRRFAKIAGEMVPLHSIEEMANHIDPYNMHAAVSVEDMRKGEQIILFTSSKLISRMSILQLIRQEGLSELSLPKKIVYMEAIPCLPIGKINYVELIHRAEELKEDEQDLDESSIDK